MSDDTSCRGCKHLLIFRGKGYCLQPLRPAVYTVDPYSGRGRWQSVEWHAGQLSGWSAPTAEEMRSCRGTCGPLRTLYEPNWKRRLWAWLKRHCTLS
jgi:hypothetical protein